jgi:hypothetical protein
MKSRDTIVKNNQIDKKTDMSTIVQPSNSAQQNQPSQPNSDDVDTRLNNAKKISEVSTWIKTVSPEDGKKDIPYSSDITITFNKDMNPDTLNKNNIIISEYKHSSVISNLFNYDYNSQDRTLSIKFKIPDNGYGTLNTVSVLIKGDISDKQNNKMGVDSAFIFVTK